MISDKDYYFDIVDEKIMSEYYKLPLIAFSGGFDPVHKGHIACMRAAKKLSKVNRLMIILNSDTWLENKKGYVFMKYPERLEVLAAIRYVDLVVPAIGDDRVSSVAYSLDYYKPLIFVNGGDRTIDTLPKDELEVCKKNGIEIVCGVGGGKIQSSSKLTSIGEKIFKPYGWEKILVQNQHYRIKKIHINPYCKNSLQWHFRKVETLFFNTTHIQHIKPKQNHRLEAGKDDLEVYEVSHGSDYDIWRLEDDYGRK